LDPAVFHPEQPRDRRLDLVDQLAEAGDQAGEPDFDRAHVDDLGDERVARLGALDRDRAGRAVDLVEVDLGDEVVLRGDLPGEAVVRLERDRRAGLDLEDRLEVGPERPDDLVTADPVVDRDCHYAGAPAGAVSGVIVSSSTYTRSMSRSRSG